VYKAEVVYFNWFNSMRYFMMTFFLKRSFLSTCAGAVLLASVSTPVLAMTNEEVASSVTAARQPRPLSEAEKERFGRFMTRFNALYDQRDDMILMRLGDYLKHPDTQQIQTTEEILPLLTLGEKLLEEGMFNRITDNRGGRAPLHQQVLEGAHLFPYLTILANIDLLLNVESPCRMSMIHLSRMSVGQIDACGRNAETLYLREGQGESIYKLLSSKTPEEIDAISKLLQKHSAILFFEGKADRYYQVAIVKELIRLPLPYLEKNMATFFPKDMSIGERVRTVGKRVSKIQKVVRKRAVKKKIQEQRKLMPNEGTPAT